MPDQHGSKCKNDRSETGVDVTKTTSQVVQNEINTTDQTLSKQPNMNDNSTDVSQSQIHTQSTQYPYCSPGESSDKPEGYGNGKPECYGNDKPEGDDNGKPKYKDVGDGQHGRPPDCLSTGDSAPCKWQGYVMILYFGASLFGSGHVTCKCKSREKKIF